MILVLSVKPSLLRSYVLLCNPQYILHHVAIGIHPTVKVQTGIVSESPADLLQLGVTNLGYFSTDPSELPTEESVIIDIVQEGAWGSVVIIQGATEMLESSRANGDTTYNGSSLVQVYYAQARNEMATGNYLVPYLQQALGQITGRLGSQLSAE